MMKIKFGKHKGKTFDEVRKEEPSYFIWLWSIKNKLDKDLYNYIKKNIKDLQREAEEEHINFIREQCGGEAAIEF